MRHKRKERTEGRGKSGLYYFLYPELIIRKHKTSLSSSILL